MTAPDHVAAVPSADSGRRPGAVLRRAALPLAIGGGSRCCRRRRG